MTPKNAHIDHDEVCDVLRRILANPVMVRHMPVALYLEASEIIDPSPYVPPPTLAELREP
jgi:hypothetical protein